jgi:hypothetical protein
MADRHARRDVDVLGTDRLGVPDRRHQRVAECTIEDWTVTVMMSGSTTVLS